MSSNRRRSSIESNSNETTPVNTVRFNNVVYTDRDSPSGTPLTEKTSSTVFVTGQPSRPAINRRKSGILKRRENTITTADAPPIILSDEGLKAGRVSPFINFPLFLSMTIRSIGIVYGDM
jgi:hypothetical protein